MDRTSDFWSRELTKRFIQYSSVGVVSLPFGLFYGILVTSGWNYWAIPASLLLVGFLASLFVWEKIEKSYLAKSVRLYQAHTSAGPAAYVSLHQIAGTVSSSFYPGLVIWRVTTLGTQGAITNVMGLSIRRQPATRTQVARSSNNTMCLPVTQ